ncbi:hypothetical protein Tco_0025847 [Tanacetum coccineum]
MLANLIEERKKFFAAKRAEEKRNKPPTKAQQRKIMCTYLKNMAGYKMQDLRHFDDGTIKEKFDKAYARTIEFVPVDEDVLKESTESGAKRAGDDLVQESPKRQKQDDDLKDSDLLQLINFVSEPVIDAIPLATKTPIIGWEKLVKSKYGDEKPKGDLDYILWNDLKNMFEPNLEDNTWRRQDGYKKYPLTIVTLRMMLVQTLRTSQQSQTAYTMASQLLKHTLKQIPRAYEAYKNDKAKDD